MSIQQYRCKKHPKLTRRASHPDGTYEYIGYDGELITQVKFKRCIPSCPICREPMEMYFDSEKGNKCYNGVYETLDENFKRVLKWNRQSKKTKRTKNEKTK